MMKKQKKILILGFVLILVTSGFISAYTAVCSFHERSNQACNGDCECESESGGEGWDDCTFYCNIEGGKTWCPRDPYFCAVEEPI